MNTFRLIKVLLFVVIMANSYKSNADAPGFSQDTEDVPLDGGISILLAAGIGYGIKKTKSNYNSAKKLIDKK
jgi:hypothetical protein